MTAPVITHEIPSDLKNDPEHPIPFLRVIDVAAYKKDGGAELSIIVASPLQGDPRSQTRLLDKIQGYLSHLTSDEFLADAGCSPNPGNTTICVALHPGSSSVIQDLLQRCHVWVESNNAKLVVSELSADQLSGT